MKNCKNTQLEISSSRELSSFEEEMSINELTDSDKSPIFRIPDLPPSRQKNLVESQKTPILPSSKTKNNNNKNSRYPKSVGFKRMSNDEQKRQRQQQERNIFLF